ncbi:MAG: hypothetical protein AB1942_02155 [Pseudomonadota bacterium]
MLVIVAAVAALVPAPEARSARPDARPTLFAPRAIALRDRPVCAGAARLQTGYEPALLYREEDRDAARLRKLIEMPMAEACLVESAR